MTDYERSLISDLRLRLFSVYCSAEDYKNNGMTVEDWFKDEVHLNPFRDHDSFGYMTWTLCKLLDLDWHKEKAEAFERYKKVSCVIVLVPNSQTFTFVQDHADEYDEDEDGVRICVTYFC